MIKMRNDYECIAYSIKMLCYEEKYEEAKKIYENCVKQGKLPQLYFDKERYAGESMPKWMCVTWNEEVTNADVENCLITIQQYFPEFMKI